LKLKALSAGRQVMAFGLYSNYTRKCVFLQILVTINNLTFVFGQTTSSHLSYQRGVFARSLSVKRGNEGKVVKKN